MSVRVKIWSCVRRFEGIRLNVSECMRGCFSSTLEYGLGTTGVRVRIWSCVRRFGGIILNVFECTRVSFSSALGYGLGTIES